MSARLAMLEAMIAKGSKDPFARYARAMELRGLGRREEALQAFDELRASAPTYVPTYLMGGQLAAELGRSDQARAFLEPGIAVAVAAGDDHAESEMRSALGSLA